MSHSDDQSGEDRDDYFYNKNVGDDFIKACFNDEMVNFLLCDSKKAWTTEEIKTYATFYDEGRPLAAMCHITELFMDANYQDHDAEAVRDLFGKDMDEKDAERTNKGLLKGLVECATRNENTGSVNKKELKKHWSLTDVWPPERGEKTFLDDLINECIQNPPYKLEESARLELKYLESRCRSIKDGLDKGTITLSQLKTMSESGKYSWELQAMRLIKESLDIFEIQKTRTGCKSMITAYLELKKVMEPTKFYNRSSGFKQDNYLRIVRDKRESTVRQDLTLLEKCFIDLLMTELKYNNNTAKKVKLQEHEEAEFRRKYPERVVGIDLLKVFFCQVPAKKYTNSTIKHSRLWKMLTLKNGHERQINQGDMCVITLEYSKDGDKYKFEPKSIDVAGDGDIPFDLEEKNRSFVRYSFVRFVSKNAADKRLGFFLPGRNFINSEIWQKYAELQKESKKHTTVHPVKLMSEWNEPKPYTREFVTKPGNYKWGAKKDVQAERGEIPGFEEIQKEEIEKDKRIYEEAFKREKSKKDEMNQRRQNEMMYEHVWTKKTKYRDDNADRTELKEKFINNVNKYWVLICVNLFEVYWVNDDDSKQIFFQRLAQDERYNSVQKYRFMWSKLEEAYHLFTRDKKKNMVSVGDFDQCTTILEKIVDGVSKKEIVDGVPKKDIPALLLRYESHEKPLTWMKYLNDDELQEAEKMLPQKYRDAYQTLRNAKNHPFKTVYEQNDKLKETRYFNETLDKTKNPEYYWPNLNPSNEEELREEHEVLNISDEEFRSWAMSILVLFHWEYNFDTNIVSVLKEKCNKLARHNIKTMYYTIKDFDTVQDNWKLILQSDKKNEKIDEYFMFFEAAWLKLDRHVRQMFKEYWYKKPQFSTKWYDVYEDLVNSFDESEEMKKALMQLINPTDKRIHDSMSRRKRILDEDEELKEEMKSLTTAIEENRTFLKSREKLRYMDEMTEKIELLDKWNLTENVGILQTWGLKGFDIPGYGDCFYDAVRETLNKRLQGLEIPEHLKTEEAFRASLALFARKRLETDKHYLEMTLNYLTVKGEIDRQLTKPGFQYFFDNEEIDLKNFEKDEKDFEKDENSAMKILFAMIEDKVVSIKAAQREPVKVWAPPVVQQIAADMLSRPIVVLSYPGGEATLNAKGQIQFDVKNVIFPPFNSTWDDPLYVLFTAMASSLDDVNHFDGTEILTSGGNIVESQFRNDINKKIRDAQDEEEEEFSKSVKQVEEYNEKFEKELKEIKIRRKSISQEKKKLDDLISAGQKKALNELKSITDHLNKMSKEQLKQEAEAKKLDKEFEAVKGQKPVKHPNMSPSTVAHFLPPRKPINAWRTKQEEREETENRRNYLLKLNEEQLKQEAEAKELDKELEEVKEHKPVTRPTITYAKAVESVLNKSAEHNKSQPNVPVETNENELDPNESKPNLTTDDGDHKTLLSKNGKPKGIFNSNRNSNFQNLHDNLTEKECNEINDFVKELVNYFMKHLKHLFQQKCVEMKKEMESRFVLNKTFSDHKLQMQTLWKELYDMLGESTLQVYKKFEEYGSNFISTSSQAKKSGKDHISSLKSVVSPEWTYRFWLIKRSIHQTNKKDEILPTTWAYKVMAFPTDPHSKDPHSKLRPHPVAWNLHNDVLDPYWFRRIRDMELGFCERIVGNFVDLLNSYITETFKGKSSETMDALSGYGLYKFEFDNEYVVSWIIDWYNRQSEVFKNEMTDTLQSAIKTLGPGLKIPKEMTSRGPRPFVLPPVCIANTEIFENEFKKYLKNCKESEQEVQFDRGQDAIEVHREIKNRNDWFPQNDDKPNMARKCDWSKLEKDSLFRDEMKWEFYIRANAAWGKLIYGLTRKEVLEATSHTAKKAWVNNPDVPIVQDIDFVAYKGKKSIFCTYKSREDLITKYKMHKKFGNITEVVGNEFEFDAGVNANPYISTCLHQFLNTEN